MVADGIGSGLQTQVQPLGLETKKSFRFLFLGGTEQALGADITVDGFRRAFGESDDVALIIAKGPQANEDLNLTWLSQIFDGCDAPEAEVITETLEGEGLDLMLSHCQALICAGDQARDVDLLSQAADHGVALILPESDIAHSSLDHSSAYPILAGIAAVGEEAPPIDVHPQDLAGVLRRVLAEPNAAAEKNRLARSHFCEETPTPKIEIVRNLPSPTPPNFGICWGAAPFNYSGYAKVTRNILSTLDRHDANYGVHLHGSEKRFIEELKADTELKDYWDGIIGRPISEGLYCSFHPPFRLAQGSFYQTLKDANPGISNIVAVTMFETDRLPDGWAAECNAADEVWVPCQFNMDSFAKGGVDPDKLRKLHLGIEAAPFINKQPTFDIPGRRAFNFLSIFDWAYRKGWDVLLRAYFAAFTADDDVSLTLRVYPAIKEQAPIKEQVRNFMAQEGIDPNRAAKIIFVDDFVSEKRMPALYQAADAFVMPSRGEGWGLPYMEAMAAGLPTIGTRWSGQLEFMNDSNSFLVDLEGLVPIFPEQTELSIFYQSDHLWAQPSACHLKELMRNVVKNQTAAREIGKIAQDEVARVWTTDYMVSNLYRLGEDLESRSARTRKARERRPATMDKNQVPNVAWTGPIYDASGYADEGRNFLHAMIQDEVNVLTFPMNWTKRLAELTPAEDTQLKALQQTTLDPEKPTVMIQHTLGEILEPSRAGFPCAGRTMFETDSLPASWVSRCNTMNRIWVPSEFNIRTFTKGGVEPHRLKILHPSIDVEQFANIGAPIDFGTGKSVNFLSVFDWTERKGWDILLRAWAEEFGPEDDVCLVLKVWSALGKSMEQIGQEIEDFLVHNLETSSKDCAEIMIYDHHIAEPDMPRLYAGADAFVLATRGEGWGRPIMEAMAAGVVTLATNWGGNTEFMNHSNSLPIDYQLVPCSPAAIKQAKWFQGHRWAECFVPHLRASMRRVAENDPELRKLAQQGRHDILNQFDRKTIGKQLQELLVDLVQAEN